MVTPVIIQDTFIRMDIGAGIMGTAGAAVIAAMPAVIAAHPLFGPAELSVGAARFAAGAGNDMNASTLARAFSPCRARPIGNRPLVGNKLGNLPYFVA